MSPCHAGYMDYTLLLLLIIIPALVSGAIGAIGAAVLTAVLAGRRERRNWEREEKLKAHTAFLAEHDRVRVQWRRDPSYSPEWYLNAHLKAVQLVANEEASHAAQRLRTASTDLYMGTRHSDPSDMLNVTQCQHEYVNAARRDIGMKPISEATGLKRSYGKPRATAE